MVSESRGTSFLNGPVKNFGSTGPQRRPTALLPLWGAMHILDLASAILENKYICWPKLFMLLAFGLCCTTVAILSSRQSELEVQCFGPYGPVNVYKCLARMSEWAWTAEFEITVRYKLTDAKTAKANCRSDGLCHEIWFPWRMTHSHWIQLKSNNLTNWKTVPTDLKQSKKPRCCQLLNASVRNETPVQKSSHNFKCQSLVTWMRKSTGLRSCHSPQTPRGALSNNAWVCRSSQDQVSWAHEDTSQIKWGFSVCPFLSYALMFSTVPFTFNPNVVEPSIRSKFWNNYLPHKPKRRPKETLSPSDNDWSLPHWRVIFKAVSCWSNCPFWTPVFQHCPWYW